MILKNVEVSIDDSYCEYKYLSCFKKVTITDNLILNGELATEESTVDFIHDKTPIDLNATIIDSNVSISVGDKGIQIGKTRFQFDSIVDVYDIILYFEETVKDVYFCKEDEVPKSSIPNVRIRKVLKASFSFSNNWKADSKRAQSHVFLFTDLDGTKIYLSVPDTAFSFQAEGELTLISTTENVGINGFFDFYQPTSLMNVRYQKSVFQSH